MTPARSRAAKHNLREGIKKMAQTMTPAAQVRRDFRLGRPPKPGELVPMHPAVVWQKATDAVANFRGRMAAVGLNPNHATASIVYIERADPELPNALLLEADGKTAEDCRRSALEILGSEDVIALGMIFRQYDEQAKKQAIFPYLFMGLNERGMAVLKRAATSISEATELLQDVN